MCGVSMGVKITSHGNTVEMEISLYGLEGVDSHLFIHVSVTTNMGFTGMTGAYFERDSWHRFLEQLRYLESQRTGIAVLVAESQTTFELRFEKDAQYGDFRAV